MPSPGAPGPCNVPRNRWDLIAVPADAPGGGVSVIVTAAAGTETGPVVDALAAGSARREVELLVPAGTAGSPPTVRSGSIDIATMDLPLGGDRAAFHNAAAQCASHEVLLFIDPDDVPTPSWIEAHARWHDAASDLVVVGRTVAADGKEPSWISGHRLRTRNLTVDTSDVFRFFPVSNMSLRRGTLLRGGGFALGSAAIPGEDEVLGHRLHQSGALFVMEDDAVCHAPRDSWPERRSHPAPAEAAWVAQRLPHPSARTPTSGRSYLVPRWEVLIDASDADIGDVAASAESVLGADTHDVVICLAGLDAPDVARWAAECYGSDQRVRLDGTEQSWSPLHLRMPAGAVLQQDALDALCSALDSPEDPADVLRVTIPGRPPSDVSVVAFTRRAWHRGAQVSPDDPLTAGAQLCGQRWVSGSLVGLGWRQAPATNEGVVVDAGVTGLDPEQFRALWDAMGALSEGERRVVLRVGQRLLSGPSWLRRVLVRVGRVLARD